MPNAASALSDDLGEVLRKAAPSKRVDMRLSVTDLFLSDAARLNDEQIDMFNNVLVQPINKIEARPRAEISVRPLHRR